MEDLCVSSIVELYRKGDWRSIVHSYHTNPARNKVLWVFPSEDNFEFIKNILADLNCNQVLSIGCGSGLLEWMLNQAIGKYIFVNFL